MPIAPPTTQVDATEVVQTIVGNHVKNSASEARTVIFLDWDDTLLCSAVLSRNGIKLDTSMKGRTELLSQLDGLTTYVIDVLETAMRHGEVHIVTNGETGWVELSCQKFLPRVVPYLSKCRVLSARSTFERMHPNNPMEWKFQAFKESLAPYYAASGDSIKNILSFGDSHAEREAIRAVTKPLPNTRCKSIKFAERPTVEQLERQLELVVKCFDYIYGHEDDLDLCMCLSVQPAPEATPEPATEPSIEPVGEPEAAA